MTAARDLELEESLRGAICAIERAITKLQSGDEAKKSRPLDMSLLCEEWVPDSENRRVTAAMPGNRILSVDLDLRRVAEDAPPDTETRLVCRAVTDYAGLELWGLRAEKGCLVLTGNGVAQRTRSIVGHDTLKMSLNYNPGTGNLAFALGDPCGRVSWGECLVLRGLLTPSSYRFEIGSHSGHADKPMWGWAHTAHFRLDAINAPPVMAQARAAEEADQDIAGLRSRLDALEKWARGLTLPPKGGRS